MRQTPTLPSLLHRRFGNVLAMTSFGRSLLVGIGTSLVLSTGAWATEVIELYDQTQSETVTIGELEAFAETGEIPEGLEAWLDTTQRVPSELRSVLTKEIYIDPKFVKNLLESSTGEFLLLKLDEVINASPAEGEINNVKSAVLDVYNDGNRLSILKLLAAYPVDTLRVDMDKVDEVYDDVKTYVEKVLPALEVAKEFLQDLLCDCDAPAEAASQDLPEGSSETSTAPSPLVDVVSSDTRLTSLDSENCAEAEPTGVTDSSHQLDLIDTI